MDRHRLVGRDCVDMGFRERSQCGIDGPAFAQFPASMRRPTGRCCSPDVWTAHRDSGRFRTAPPVSPLLEGREERPQRAARSCRSLGCHGHGFDGPCLGPGFGELLLLRAMAQAARGFSGGEVRPSAQDGEITLAFFSPDGRALHLVTQGGLFVTTRLNPWERSPDDIAREIGVRTGLVFDSKGGLRILQPDELAAIWEKR